MTRPVSHSLSAIMPATLAVLLVLLSAVPGKLLGLTLTPNIAWILSWIFALHAPMLWPRGVAFALGLLQDVLFGTPLGAQALLALLLVQWGTLERERGVSLKPRVRLPHTAIILTVWHGLLWLVLALVIADPPPLSRLLVTGLVNGLWCVLFYNVARRLFATRMAG